MKRSINQIVEETKGTIPSNYSMSYDELMQLSELAAVDVYKAIVYAYQFGYALGGKAAISGKTKKRAAAKA